MSASNKKRAAAGEVESGRDRKKAKLLETRHITVQNVTLPNTVSIEKFIQARAFEIKAMEGSMKTTRSDGATHRVFQTLPRHMRRRAASHDHRRVPKRHRERALAEIGDAVRVKKRIPKRGFAKRLTKTEVFLRRQKDKTWLETHLWHAKRMHMANLWGYRLAESPTTKAFRASHRAALHDCILHDASYYGTIEISGTLGLLQCVLARITDAYAVAASSARYNSGVRTCETFLYAANTYPLGLIGPALLLWRAGESESVTQRTVWMRLHPAMFNAAWTAVTTAAGQALEGTENQQLEIADLRDELVAFELMGQKSSRILAGAFQPDWNKCEDETQEFWKSLSDLSTTASVPRGMVVGLTVIDPRVTFPPKNSKHSDEPVPFHYLPTPTLATTEIWNAIARSALQNPRFRKRDLDARREKNLIPGTRLKPVEEDSRIPIMLVQRTVGSTHHGWLLLAPRGWGTAFMHSLIYTGTRVAGQRERMTQYVEAGERVFPGDFPSIAASQEWWNVRAASERGRWERRPKNKRVDYVARGIRSPFLPDWEEVLGLPGLRQGESLAHRGATGQTAQIWLARGEHIERALRDSTLHQSVAEARAKRSLSAVEIDPEVLLQTAVVSVRVHMVGRGAPGDMAVIYALSGEQEHKLWVHALNLEREGATDVDDSAANNLGRQFPPSDSIIGYITTSSYSLTRGRGFGVGAVSAAAFAKLSRSHTALRSTRYAMLVKVRDRDGLLCRAATLELIA
ncbi:POP1-domain-containing protein [Auriculariales sp. MPI-PUGE-AT-0066]|nr:POP1-domain-containing protein [Auriculariales sp. MPI-PUGE-AT-0066]